MSRDLPTVAITGATGALGGAVARALQAGGMPLRLLVRSVARAPHLAGAVVLPCAYSDRSAADVALEGVETLFMVSASESADRLDEHRDFIDAARAAGVGHIVYTSFLSAAPDATFTLARDHYATEEMIRAAGVGFTFLRDSLYADFMAALVGDDGVIRGPAGDGRVAIVTRADIARVATSVMADPAAHRDVTYDVTGPEALSMGEIARLLSKAGDRSVVFHDESVTEAYESRRRWAAPSWQNDAWVSTYTAIASGELSTVSTDVHRVTGRLPMSLQEFLVESTAG